MPEPLALCIEDLDAGGSRPRYLRCVALVGREPGLRLTERGEILWQSTEPRVLELWVSQDDRLILFRCAGGPQAVVLRQGRLYDVPEEKPVVLLDGDDLEVGGRRLRLHLHGRACAVVEPSPLPDRGAMGLAKVAAAALALGTVVGGPGSTAEGEQHLPLEVRLQPPDQAPPPRPDAGVNKPPPKKTAPKKKAPEKASDPENVTPSVVPLEVRDKPPAPPPMPRPDAGVKNPTPSNPAPKKPAPSK